MSVSKGELIEYYAENGLAQTQEWLIEKHKAENIHVQLANTKAYEKVCVKIHSDFVKLRKSASRETGRVKLNNFKLETVNFPKPSQTPLKRKSETEDLDKIALKRRLETFQDVASNLAEDLVSTKGENETLKEKLAVAEEIAKIKVTKKGGVEKFRKIAKQAEIKSKRLEKEVMALKSTLQKKTKDIKHLRLKLSYSLSRHKNLEEKVGCSRHEVEKLVTEKERLQNEIDNLLLEKHDNNDTISDLKAENEWLREMVTQENVIQTYDEEKKAYSLELQKCVYALLELNVTASKVSSVIEAVMTLANTKINKLPCKSTVLNMNIQRLILAQKQLGEEFANKKNTCLLGDETSKYGNKFQGLHASDEEGRLWTLGIRQMVTKSGKDILQTLQQILLDIDEVSQNSDNSLPSKRILLNISSTMSDRATTQVKFNTLLEEFRTNVLKEDLGEVWDTMTEVEQMSVSKLCNFFCSLHALVHMADVSSKALQEIEQATFDGNPPIFDKRFYKATEPGTTRLIRTACKAFALGGDEKNGVHQHFQCFARDLLNEKNLKSLPLDRFRGNRFNILFENAGGVFFLKDQMTQYLSGCEENNLLKAVKADLNVPEYIAGCKALGLISELITKPLWSQIEDESIHILDTTTIYKELVQYLGNFADNKLDFIEGRYFLSFVNEENLHGSCIFESLVSAWEHDGLVISILDIIIPSLLKVINHIFRDFLTDGLWESPSQLTRDKTHGVPKHNKYSEGIFGHLDRILREKPNVSLIASEAYIMFVHNKTLAWLNSKSDEEQRKLVETAKKGSKKMREKYKSRQLQIEEERKRLVAQRLAESERKQQESVRKLEDQTNEIQLWGLWQSETEIDDALKRLKTAKDRTAAISAQLAFRKNVFKQKVPNDVCIYRKSKKVNNKTVKLTEEELVKNVKTLVRQAYSANSVTFDTEEPIILGRKVRHAYESDGVLTWYTGHVISQVPGYPSWFNIKYSGDPAIYTYELLKDYERGELVLVL